MNEILDTRTVDDVEYRVYLEQDSECEDPRGDACHVGVIVTVRNSRYLWPAEDGDRISAGYVRDAMEDHSFRVVARWLRMFHGATVVLPLYAAGDEGRPVAGDVTDDADARDYTGVTFDQPSTREVTGLTGTVEIAAALSTEIDEYSTWAVGDCYGYVIERQVTEDSDPIGIDVSDSEGWEQVDSLWGLVGGEYARQAAVSALSDL